MRTKPFVRVRYEPTSSPEQLTARMTQLSKMGDKAPVFLEVTLLTYYIDYTSTDYTYHTSADRTCYAPVFLEANYFPYCTTHQATTHSTHYTTLTTLTRRPCTRARRR